MTGSSRSHGASGALISFIRDGALAIGREEAPPLPEAGWSRPEWIDPWDVAGALLDGVPAGGGLTTGDWGELWPRTAGTIREFLTAVETRTGADLLAARTLRILERRVLEAVPSVRPWPCGRTLALTLDLGQGVTTLEAGPGLERAHVTVRRGRHSFGALLLPVIDNMLDGPTLADAIARAYGWRILGVFFAENVYPALEWMEGDGGQNPVRGGAALGPPLRADQIADPVTFHDAIGWTVFLQELWGAPGIAAGAFYDAQAPDLRDHRPGGDPAPVEVAAPLPAFAVDGAPVFEVRVGGAALGLVDVVSGHGRVTPAAIRAAVTLAGGMELCTVTVREALVRPGLDGRGTLRERLVAASRGPRPVGPFSLARRDPFQMGGGSCRMAALPRHAVPALRRMADGAGEAWLQAEAAGAVRYNPAVIGDGADRPARTPDETGTASPARHDRHYFEQLFAGTADPWKYTTEYEQLKYRQTLEQVPAAGAARALEIGCAEGHFTGLLAARVQSLVAVDISAIALERAAARVNHSHVEFRRLDLFRDPLDGRYDVIVCSEVLYFAPGAEGLEAAGKKLRDALVPGGTLVLAHANVLADDPNETGLDWDVPFGARGIGTTLARIPGLGFEREVQTDLYRIQVFRRLATEVASPDPSPGEILTVPCAPPRPEVAAMFRRGQPRARSQPLPSVPILMYHRVADGDSPYAVSPAHLSAQLDYLAGAGFTGIGLHDWKRAVEGRAVLPARPVILTFDDGYRDFASEAWPLLSRYGFPATVFLVADAVGGTSTWEHGAAANIPLLDWETIRTLHAEGVTFGAHSVGHRPLTGLPPAEIVAAVVEARLRVQDALGEPVTLWSSPYGDTDDVVEHLVGACGFQVAVGTRSGVASPADGLLALPRQEVRRADDLHAFIASLGA